MMGNLHEYKTRITCNDFLHVLEEVIPSSSDVIVIYHGIWTFAHLFEQPPSMVANYLLDCLDRYLGKNKTLILPAFCASNFVKTKVYDMKKSLPKESGMLSIAALTKGNFSRTNSPMHSYLVRGPMKDDVLNLHPATSWGDDSILDWMVDVNARICPLGLDWHKACSLFHRIEEILQVPYRYYKKFNGDMYNDGKFIHSCSEVKYSYPLQVPLELDHSIVTPILKKDYQTPESSDDRIFMQSAGAKDILSACNKVLSDDIYAYVKNKDNAIDWVENYKSLEVDGLSENEKYIGD